jgi:hypothetical protein
MIKFICEHENRPSEHEIRAAMKVQESSTGSLVICLKGTGDWVNIATLCSSEGNLIMAVCEKQKRESLPGISFNNNGEMVTR